MKLPPDQLAHDGDCWLAPRCPWCHAEMAEATLTVESLFDAYTAGEALRYAPREPDGQAGAGALVVACPSCCRPSAIALRYQLVPGLCTTRIPTMRLVAVRTAADAALLARPPHE